MAPMGRRCGLVLTLGLASLCSTSKVDVLSWEEAEAKAAKVLQELTPEERHSLMRGVGWVPFIMMGFPIRHTYMGNIPAIPRLGVPPMKSHDAANGFRNQHRLLDKSMFGSTTSWPSALALAASWDVDMTGRVAAAIAKEFKGKGANVLLGPAVQVHRVARNGRNFEYMSGDDPYLGARLAEAYVKAVQEQGVLAVAKHWAFNEQETERMTGSSEVDERTAWELYYPPFEAAVKAGVGSIMCSYNKVNGTYACENEALLLRDLKGRLGFRGFVMSDWWAAHSNSVLKGLDQEMPGIGAGWVWNRHGPFLTHDDLEDAELGIEPPKDFLGRAKRWLQRLFGSRNEEEKAQREAMARDPAFLEPAKRILAATYKVRLDLDPGCTPQVDCEPQYKTMQASPWHQKLAQEAATGGVVLLKNTGVLPLNAEQVKSVALIGKAFNAPSSHMPTSGFMPPPDYYSGGGSGHVGAGDGLVTPLAGITARAAKAGIRVVTSLSNNVTEALQTARGVDIVIALGATSATEEVDRPNLNLDDGADKLISALALKFPTVVLVQAPGVVLMPWRMEAAGIAIQFLGGEQTGSAWASVLFGDVSPSGKLPIMLPKDASSTIEPSLTPVKYTEGLFTSYRAKDAEQKAAFPFGHGLSYAIFKYTQLGRVPDEECLELVCVSLAVINDCWRKGAEVVQAYVELPKQAKAPRLQLKGFHRTAVLGEGDTELVTFRFTARDLSAYLRGRWRLMPEAKIHVGASSMDIRWSLDVQVPPAKLALAEAQLAEAAGNEVLAAQRQAQGGQQAPAPTKTEL